MNQLNRWKAAFLMLCVSVVTFAQDGKLLDIDIDVNKAEWYEQPWVWAVGIGILVLGVLIGRKR